MTATPFACRALAVVGIALAMALADARVTSCEFVILDDHAYLVDNPDVREGFSWNGFLWSLTARRADNWHPVTWLSHMLDCQLFGLDPARHHAVNLLLGMVNACLVYLWLEQATGKSGRAFLVALLFAVHPLNVETIAWVAERKSILCSLFWLLLLLAYCKPSAPGAARWSLIVLLAALSLASKPMAVTIPCALLLMDYWPLQRAPWPDRRHPEDWRTWSKLALEKWPLWCLVGGSIFATWQAQQSARASFSAIPLTLRLANAAISYARYLERMLWPVGLAIPYPHPMGDVSPIALLVSLAAITSISIVAFVLRRRQPALIVGWLWYLGTMVPVIGLVQVGKQGMADRYAYVPMLGLLMAAVWTISDLLERRPRVLRYAAVSLTIAFALALGACSSAQLAHWKSSASLFEHALAVTQRNVVAAYLAGLIHARTGNLTLGEQRLRQAVEWNPNDYQALISLGDFFAETNREADSLPLYNRAIAVDPNGADAYLRRGLLRAGRPPMDAIADLTRALQKDPRNPAALRPLVARAQQLGQPALAEPAVREALRQDPRDGFVWALMGHLLLQRGAVKEAQDAYERALSLRCVGIEREVANNLAWSYSTDPNATDRKGGRAVELVERWLDQPSPSENDTIAAAYAEAGRFDDAIRVAKQALAALDPIKEKALHDAIQQRLTGYLRRQPYRESR